QRLIVALPVGGLVGRLRRSAHAAQLACRIHNMNPPGFAQQRPFVALFFAVQDWQRECDAALFMVLPDAHYRPEEVRSLGPHKVISITPPAIDRRIPAQKSVFTFHPYGDPHGPFVPLDMRDEIGNQITTKNNELTRGFAKIVIPKRLKRHLFHNLLQAGIDRRNLFPGLDGVGVDIAARMQIGMLS
ncbi:MAG: hypothetical protein AB7U46_14035, partial [Paenirhodobacter sp.]|uniref:hypothetical protein n=1 Tax=Paenirhodobacter sp. TaxID=1965326 RepID=UPI003D0FEA5E